MGGMTEALGGIASLHDRFIETTAQLARMQAEMERLRHEVPVQSLRNVANRTLYNAINILQRPLSRLMVVVMRDPRRSHRINNWLLTHFPALHGQLRDVGRLQGIVPGEPPPEEPEAPITFADLTPRARQIYIDLNTAIEKQQEGRAHEDSD